MQNLAMLKISCYGNELTTHSVTYVCTHVNVCVKKEKREGGDFQENILLKGCIYYTCTCTCTCLLCGRGEAESIKVYLK